MRSQSAVRLLAVASSFESTRPGVVLTTESMWRDTVEVVVVSSGVDILGVSHATCGVDVLSAVDVRAHPLSWAARALAGGLTV